MNINDIKPAKIKYEPTVSEKFKSVELDSEKFKNKPNAYELRTILVNRKITQREAARILDLPWHVFQSWIMPCRSTDVPNFVLNKLKEFLK